jgi:hypothetical protein
MAVVKIDYVYFGNNCFELSFRRMKRLGGRKKKKRRRRMMEEEWKKMVSYTAKEGRGKRRVGTGGAKDEDGWGPLMAKLIAKGQGQGHTR